MTPDVAKFPAFAVASEPRLAFHPERREDSHLHPLRGLIQFGPYSRSLVNTVLDPIRVAVIAPQGWMRGVDRFLAEFEQRHKPRERKQYLPEFPGFSSIFGLRIVSDPSTGRIELPKETDSELHGSELPHLALAEKLSSAVSQLDATRPSFDLLLVVLPERWSFCFTGGSDDDFDLHDYLKAVTANRGIPMQIVLENSALSYFCRCSVMWRLSLAFYAKAGGVPWKLAGAEAETAFVGISYALRDRKDGPRFVTCCSQVFDSDGAGLRFLLYNANPDHLEGDNPFLSRSEMRRLMARSVVLYQRQHGGRSPKRVVVHKTTHFTQDEVDGCFDAWKSADGLDLLQVQRDSPWRGVKLEPAPTNRGGPSIPARYPVDRGTYIGLDERRVVLWTQGNVAGTVTRGDYFKEGKGIPSPLMLRRYAGHGSWDFSCSSVLGLSKMNWNNDGLYDQLPVTLSYASVLARCVKRMPHISPQPYELRYFM